MFVVQERSISLTYERDVISIKADDTLGRCHGCGSGITNVRITSGVRSVL